MGNHIPNMDATPAEDLIRWGLEHHNASPTVAAHVLPGRPADYQQTVQRLGAYAMLQAVAMSRRAAGDILLAQRIEQQLDWLYAQLPPYAQW